MRTQIFISYRRNGGLDIARKIHERLRNSYEVFFDMESLRSGRFDQKIENAIRECTDFLLILSAQIFDRFEEDGDWISRELQLAIESGKNIIPVFLDGFELPKTENSIIKDAMNYNGICYSDGIAFFEALELYLKSSKTCVLPLICTEGGYHLTEAAIDALKEVYRNTVNSKEYGIQIKLAFPDVHNSAKMLTGSDHVPVIDMKEQMLIRKHQIKRDSIEVAIEYMIGDTMNIETAPLRSLLKENALTSSYFEDNDGRRYSYYPVCVWVHVIEELMKEFTLDAPERRAHYADWSRYVPIDCGIDRISDKVKGGWYFLSHAEVSECNEPHLYYPIFKPSPFSLSPTTILQMILPDFYYKVAHEICYSHDEKLITELKDPESNIRILGYYWYGLH